MRVTEEIAKYKEAVEQLKQAIVENSMSYDAKDSRLGGSPNQMNILSAYSDCDLDANEMETNFRRGLYELLGFILQDIELKNGVKIPIDAVKFTFNRDMLMNEADIIQSVRSLAGLVSQETLLGQLPFIDDAKREIERRGGRWGRCPHTPGKGAHPFANPVAATFHVAVSFVYARKIDKALAFFPP